MIKAGITPARHSPGPCISEAWCNLPHDRAENYLEFNPLTYPVVASTVVTFHHFWDSWIVPEATTGSKSSLHMMSSQTNMWRYRWAKTKTPITMK